MRGNDLRDAAKCMILMIKLGKKTTKYALAVVPGDRRVSMPDIKALFGATYVSFASAEIAERLAGSVAGTILPFVLNSQSELELIVDPSIGRVAASASPIGSKVVSLPRLGGLHHRYAAAA